MNDWQEDFKDGKRIWWKHLGGENYAEIHKYKKGYILYGANDTRRVEEATHTNLEAAKKEAEGWT